VSYEASYLPFLFTSDASDSDATPAANLKGRRAFKRGREVADEVRIYLLCLSPASISLIFVVLLLLLLLAYVVQYQPVAPVVPAAEAKPPAASTSKSAGKPKQISSLSGRTGSNSKKIPNAPKGKTARQAIYDNSGVGADLRAQKVDPDTGMQNMNTSPAPSKPPPPNVFLKPAGVDEPAESTKSASTSAARTPPSDSAERKPKVKREREQTAENAEGEGSKKRKRKKKNDQAGAVE